MSEFSRQNDDDLFDYDPSKDKPKVSHDYISSSSNSKVSNEVYDQITKSIEENDDENYLKVNGLRIKFSQAILNSYDYWISPIGAISSFVTISQVLDQLTGGRFSSLYLYNYLETSILRRKHIIYLLSQTFDQVSRNKDDDDSFREFLARLDVKVSDSYIPTYVGTLVRISSHILAKDRAMYITLANKLDIVPNASVLESTSSPSEVYNNSQQNVKAASDCLLQETFNKSVDMAFAEKLNNLNGTQVDYQLRSI